MSAISLPRPMTIRWSAVMRHLAHQVAGDEDGAALAARCCMKLRIHRMPSGSSPLTGSSNISTCGSPSSAAAIPSRWRHAEREPLDPLARHRRSCPVSSSTSPTRSRGMPLLWASAEQVAAGRPARRARPWRRAARRPRAAGRAASTYGRPLTSAVPAFGRSRPEDQPHRGGLARAVRPEEPGHRAGLDGEGQVVDRDLVAVALGQAARLDHELSRRWLPMSTAQR